MKVHEYDILKKSECVVAYTLDSATLSAHDTKPDLGFITLPSREPPEGYDEAEAITDLREIAEAVPSSTYRSYGERVTGTVDVLYPLSVAAVASQSQLRLTARKLIYPEGASHLLAGLDLANLEGNRSGYGYTGSGQSPHGPFREQTADHVIMRLQHHIDQPTSVLDYAGAACASKWLTGTTMALMNHALPPIADVIAQSPASSVIRHGATLSALQILNDDRSPPPQYDYAGPLVVAAADDHPQIKAHSAAALCELASITVPNEYGLGRPEPDAFRHAADELLRLLMVDQREVQRRVLRWVASLRWDEIEDVNPDAIPENARERSSDGIDYCIEQGHPVVRDRAEKVGRTYRRNN